MENHDQLYVHSSEPFASRVISFFNRVEFSKQNNSIKIDTHLSDSINGFVQPMLESMKHPDVLASLHIPRVLAGSTIPETHVSEADIDERQLWHDIYGYHNSRNNRSYNRTEGCG
ncbi:hypothetical protein M8C21_001919 [Ambrosia artemisiifolia]|uniref:Uncharacterized protein n=1 Tax=Ambrosia artemisiifolia TaxID=4212 RepID=A0AAD5GVX9_AMBAR|nr:hypothetical protein M8C21_001919 [Ambrosia artemisiifolia]